MGRDLTHIVADLMRSAPTLTEVVICNGCGACADSPPLGVPEGWDGAFKNGVGFVFTCPKCLDLVEGEFLRGGAAIRLLSASSEASREAGIGHER